LIKAKLTFNLKVNLKLYGCNIGLSMINLIVKIANKIFYEEIISIKT